MCDDFEHVFSDVPERYSELDDVIDSIHQDTNSLEAITRLELEIEKSWAEHEELKEKYNMTLFELLAKKREAFLLEQDREGLHQRVERLEKDLKQLHLTKKRGMLKNVVVMGIFCVLEFASGFLGGIVSLSLL